MLLPFSGQIAGTWRHSNNARMKQRREITTLVRGGGATLVWTKVKGEGKVISFGVHRVTQTYEQIPWSKLCTQNVSDDFSLSFYLRSLQGSTPLSPMLLSLFFVSFVHCCCDATSQLFSLKRRGASRSILLLHNEWQHSFLNQEFSGTKILICTFGNEQLKLQNIFHLFCAIHWGFE